MKELTIVKSFLNCNISIFFHGNEDNFLKYGNEQQGRLNNSQDDGSREENFAESDMDFGGLYWAGALIKSYYRIKFGIVNFPFCFSFSFLNAINFGDVLSTGNIILSKVEVILFLLLL